MLLPGVNCRPSLAPDHPALEVTPTLGAPEKQRKTYTICGISNTNEFAVYNNNFTALVRAVKERVFYVNVDGVFQAPPRPQASLFVERMTLPFKTLKQMSHFSNPLTQQQFADLFRARKFVIYSNAVKSLQMKPFSTLDSYIQAFAKCEKYNFTLKFDPVPRIIQPRKPRYNVEVGRYIKPIEKKVYRNINKMFGSPTIMKGLNSAQRGKVIQDHWSSFDDPVAVGLDASRFDQHVSVEHLKWEHNIYKSFYPGDKLFSMLLKLQLNNKCFASTKGGKVKYTTKGCRMSGDMNTSLGNCLLMASMVYAYAKERDVKIKLVNDGDDCVVFMERKHLSRFLNGLHKWFHEMGMNMVAEEPVDVLEKIVFCQCQPVFDGDVYIMVRDPRIAMAKDCLSVKPLDNAKITKRWASAIGLGGMALTGGIPVWQDFYQLLTTIGDGAKALVDPTMMTGLYYLGKGMDRRYRPPSTESRVSFWRAFDCSPDSQYAVEEFHRNTKIDVVSKTDCQRFVQLPL
jgi:hypothetical protein